MLDTRCMEITTSPTEETMQITPDTRLEDIAAHYGTDRVYDSLDAIGEDLIDTRRVGDDWGYALDRVLREHSSDATVAHLRDDLYANERDHISCLEED